MRSEAQKRADTRWQKENVSRLFVKLYKNTDEDILKFLEGIENKQGYIKQLIRDDMKRKGE